MANGNRPGGLLGSIKGHIDAYSANKYGKAFIRSGDFTAAGIKRFAEENDLGVQDMVGIVDIASKFKKFEQESTPKPVEPRWQETIGPGGEKRIGGYSKQTGDKLFDVGKTGQSTEQKLLDELDAIIRKRGVTGPIDVKEAVEKQTALAPGIVQAAKDKQTALAPGIVEGAVAKKKALMPFESKLINLEAAANKPENQIVQEANKALGKEIGKSVQKTIAAGREAVNQNVQLDTVALALAGGARTGFGEETILNLRSLGQTFGIDTGSLAGGELVRKLSNEMALRLRNPDSGLGLTGNTSNKDLDFLKASVVGLGRTEEGNKEIIKAMQRFNGMKIAIANEQSRLIKENGGSVPSDIDANLLSFANAYELFSPKEREQISSITGDIGPVTSEGQQAPTEDPKVNAFLEDFYRQQ